MIIIFKRTNSNPLLQAFLTAAFAYSNDIHCKKVVNHDSLLFFGEV